MGLKTAPHRKYFLKKNIKHDYCCPISTKFLIKLPRGSPRPIKPFQALSGTLMSSRLHKGSWRKLIVLTGFQRFNLNKNFSEGSLGFTKPPDTISSFVRIHQVLQDFRKRHLEPCQDSQCPSSSFMESWRTLRISIKLGMVSWC